MNTTPFSGGDTSDLYTKNRNKLGEAWYYYNTPVEYQWNKNSFRMNHEIKDTQWDTYIYFTGCSYTVGVGVELEKTFPYIVSKDINCDYVNTSVGGASVELVLQNTVDFLTECEKLPKAIVINWPEISRTSWWEDDGSIGVYIPKYYGGGWESSYKEFIIHDLHITNRFAHIRKTMTLLCKSINVPLLEISTALAFDPSSDSVHDGIIPMPSYHRPIEFSDIHELSSMHHYWARDFGHLGGGHPGWYHHANAAKYITKWLRKI